MRSFPEKTSFRTAKPLWSSASRSVALIDSSVTPSASSACSRTSTTSNQRSLFRGDADPSAKRFLTGLPAMDNLHRGKIDSGDIAHRRHHDVKHLAVGRKERESQ